MSLPVGRTSVKSTVSKDSLNRQLRMAELRISKLELELDVQKKMLEVDKEYAKLEEEMSTAGGISRQCTLAAEPSESKSKMDYVQTYVDSLPEEVVSLPIALNDQKTENQAGCQSQNNLTDIANLLNVCMSLPPRKLKKFDGNPSNYHCFIRGFMTTIARYTTDPSNLLAYLIAHCENEALDAIQRCTILDPDQGYAEALRILERRFGAPHVVARRYIDELTDGPSLKPDDHKSLIGLAESMQLCSVTLKSLRFESDMNACRTLASIVQRLPPALQARWSEVASVILKKRREPNFDDLTSFISDKADAAAAKKLYSQQCGIESRSTRDIHKNQSEVKTTRFSASTLLTNTAAIAASKSRNCLCCSGMHYLDECPKFREKSLTEKRTFVEQQLLCFLCLKPNHLSRTCLSRRNCGFEGCTGRHHPLLHRSITKVTQIPDATTSLDEFPSSNGTVNHSAANISGRLVSLAVLPVRLKGPCGELIVNALLDTGSDTTLIDGSVLQQLGIQGSPVRLSLNTVTDEKKLEALVVSFEIESIDRAETLNVKRALAVSSLPKVKPLAPSSAHAFRHLEGAQFSTCNQDEISLLIGCDVPKAHWVFEQKVGRPDDPYAVKGPLGWVLLGPLQKSHQINVHTNYLSQDAVLSAKLDRMYEFEFKDTINVKRGLSVEDRAALESMEGSLRSIDGHYQISLPWIEGAPRFPDARRMALKRLYALKGRLDKDECFRTKYGAKVAEYIKLGYAEMVPELEQNKTGGSVWYLPHHGVVKLSDPSKVRVVFDCAAKVDGTSLNSQLRTGPDLVNSLCGVLLRFRQHAFVLVADIEAMFHQVRVSPADRDALRFLWWPDGDTSSRPIAYRMTVHPFGATSSPSCASLALQRTIETHMAVHGVAAKNIAQRCFYVDDCILSLQDTDELKRIALQLHEALLKCGFNLTKFFSNSEEVQKELPLPIVAPKINLDRQPDDTRRTLGVEWDSAADCFKFEVEPWKGDLTRRSLLSYVASLFDPLGLVAPFLLPAKRIIQNLCRRKAGWDDALMSHEVTDWNKWLISLANLEHLRLPRCVKPNSFEPLYRAEIHGFSDACELGYGAALYLRLLRSDGMINCTLLLGKSRVAPLKSTSIPRMELAAAVLVAKLAAFVNEELTLEIACTNFWTDSMIVLQLIRNRNTRFETFVANRLSVIHDLCNETDWFFVPGKLNPADLASRGMQMKGKQQELWFYGPQFLWKPREEWFQQPLASEIPEHFVKNTGNACVNTAVRVTEWFDRFAGASSWMSLLRKVAWLSRFVQWLSQRYLKRFSGTITRSRLTIADIKVTEMSIVRIVQRSHFSGIIDTLREEGISSGERKHPIRSLNPFLNEDVMRVGGRLRWAPIPFDVRHPIILPRDCFVTKLIVRHYHELNGHIGTLQVLAMIRERYWIIKGHSTVRQILRDCMHCKIWFSQPGGQMMAPLPSDRMRINESPFTVVGIDYFGPLLVKRGRGTEKRYGCLFTCLTMRAVHLEVAHSLETDSFLCAFSRFVARRGYPSRVYSDNGTNFRGAEAELKRHLKHLDQKRIVDKMLEKGCDWIFTPPRASHRGGIWERLIRSARRILRSILGEQLVSDEVLMTVMTEVENILNNRPLVKLSDDPEDFSVLTPNHLLLLKGNEVEADTTSCNRLIRKWKQSQHIADTFWSRWLKEYLPQLQSIQKWQRVRRNLRVGDLVLLTDTARRGLWPKGIIQQPITGKDGKVREALVRTTTGTFRRDVRQLCLLEEAPEDDSPES